jgi:hypothetical protein
MITADDIAAFQEGNTQALDAASEYARRAAKGLPPDRFTDGTAGALLVAQGIMAQQRIIAMQTAALVDLYEAMKRAGADAMRLHSQDSKYHD